GVFKRPQLVSVETAPRSHRQSTAACVSLSSIHNVKDHDPPGSGPGRPRRLAPGGGERRRFSRLVFPSQAVLFKEPFDVGAAPGERRGAGYLETTLSPVNRLFRAFCDPPAKPEPWAQKSSRAAEGLPSRNETIRLERGT